jgi:hypothetical protein
MKFLFKKYDAAFAFAMARVAALEVDLTHNDASWFAVFILVLYDRNEGHQPFLIPLRGSFANGVARIYTGVPF